MEREAGNRNAGDADLDELQTLRHARLVEPVGDLAAERGQDEERKNEYCARERDQRLGILGGELEQDQERERVLQEVVVEGAEELAPEQRRKPPRDHQFGKHRWPRV